MSYQSNTIPRGRRGNRSNRNSYRESDEMPSPLSPGAASNEERPKLQLKPRDDNAVVSAAPIARNSETRSSVFGESKPVDTAAKQLEVEKRLAEEERNKVKAAE